MRRDRVDLSDAFALVLQRHRIAQGLSRVGLAQRAQLSQTYVGLIERSLRNPSLDAADALAEALGLPLSKLVAEAEISRKQVKGTPPKT